MPAIEESDMPDFENYKVELTALCECGLSQIEAVSILEIALEYAKPNQGKWNSNT